jgi:hypothetical protein
LPYLPHQLVLGWQPSHLDSQMKEKGNRSEI